MPSREGVLPLVNVLPLNCRSSWIRRLSLLLTVVILLVGFAAVRADLHRALHADAECGEIQCAVAAFASGSVEFSAPEGCAETPVGGRPEFLPLPAQETSEGRRERFRGARDPPAKNWFAV